MVLLNKGGTLEVCVAFLQSSSIWLDSASEFYIGQVSVMCFCMLLNKFHVLLSSRKHEIYRSNELIQDGAFQNDVSLHLETGWPYFASCFSCQSRRRCFGGNFFGKEFKSQNISSFFIRVGKVRRKLLSLYPTTSAVYNT